MQHESLVLSLDAAVSLGPIAWVAKHSRQQRHRFVPVGPGQTPTVTQDTACTR